MTHAHLLLDYVPQSDPEGTPFIKSFEDSANICEKPFSHRSA